MPKTHVRLLWLLAGLAAVSAGCERGGGTDLPVVKSPFGCEDSWPPSQPAPNIPSDWDAAVGRITGCIAADEYQVVRRESEATYGAWAHMRLGFAIRNEWIRPDSSPLAADLRALGFEYPDDMSAALLSAVWHQIHGLRMDVRARVGTRIPDPDFRCDDDQTVEAARSHWGAAGR
jgi:hypothetical protein